jgi:outer membrane receptor protein involved in Fe transport
MDAPVNFKRDGIDELILANANEGIHTAFPEADLLIREEEFPIASNFRQPSSGVSFYHQSTWRTGRWTLTAGLRADWEHTAITYRNRAEINYRFTLTMPDYRPLAVEMEGSRSRSFLEVMPRASAMYDLGTVGNVYASVSRGYKAGGYNTQIFSDIVQNRMMNDMMADLGIYFGDGQNYDIEKAISYEPERSWNWEVGGHFSGFDGRLSVDAALFWIDCRNQQLTVFPPGRGTGRLMSNAGRTRSVGAEVTVTYSTGGLLLTGSYGHTDARFTEYNDGREDYSGGRVPYAPANTLSARAQYTFALRGGRAGELTPGVGVQGVGRIVWSEANTISQPFYSLVSASVDWRRGDVGVSLWARNITGADYNTFYFRSVGRSFVQRGKPLQAGIAISLTL